MEKQLSGRTALVTGAGRNIGRAIALALAVEGADVVVNARSNAAGAEAVAREAGQLGVRALPVLADLGEPDQVERMIEQVGSELGGVDILVANAAIRPRKPFGEVSYEELRTVMAVNFESTFRLVQAFSPGMRQRGWGRIITMVGLNSWSGQSQRAHVSAAKMATLGLTRALSKEFAPDGVLVNCISPGHIETTTGEGRTKPLPGERLARIPVGRAGRPEDIAATCRFLASDDAAFLSGQMIAVNGGESSV